MDDLNFGRKNHDKTRFIGKVGDTIEKLVPEIPEIEFWEYLSFAMRLSHVLFEFLFCVENHAASLGPSLLVVLLDTDEFSHGYCPLAGYCPHDPCIPDALKYGRNLINWTVVDEAVAAVIGIDLK